MTVLSIGRLRRNGRSGVLIDKLLAFDALLFLAGLAILALGAVALAFVIE